MIGRRVALDFALGGEGLCVGRDSGDAVLGHLGMSGQMLATFPGRSGATKSRLIKEGGGNKESERAVALALAWIAKQQKQEGKKVCIELIQQIREIEGVAGVHVMAYRQEEYVSEIITDSGIFKNRQPRRPTKERLAS